MAIDPSIALQTKGITMPDPMAMATQGLTLAHLGMQNQQAQIAMQASQELPQAMQLAAQFKDPEQAIAAVAQQYPRSLPAVSQMLRENAFKMAEAAKNNAQAGNFNQSAYRTASDVLGNQINAAMNSGQPISPMQQQQFALQAQHAARIGGLDPGSLTIPQGNDPGQWQQLLTTLAGSGANPEQQAKAKEIQSLLPGQLAQQPATLAKTQADTGYAQANTGYKTAETNQLPAKLANETMTAQAHRTSAGAAVSNANTSANRLQMEQEFSQLSPEALTNAAARYNVDGTLPTLPMGRMGAMARAAILNQAAQQAQGVDPSDQRVNQLSGKADAGAMNQLTKQQTMVSAFEKTFNANADNVVALSQKVDRTGVPVVNRWLMAGKRSVTGDPDVSAFDVYIKGTSNEFSKIISGSMGNTAMAEGEIKKAEGLLNGSQAPDQVLAAVEAMRNETRARMKGFQDQQTELRGHMRGAPPPTIQSSKAGGGQPAAPKLGEVRDGYLFNGGDPADQASWKRVQ